MINPMIYDGIDEVAIDYVPGVRLRHDSKKKPFVRKTSIVLRVVGTKNPCWDRSWFVPLWIGPVEDVPARVTAVVGDKHREGCE